MGYDLTTIQQTWQKQENEKLEHRRKYKHFDYRINRVTTKVANDIWNPDYVSGFSFYPFIKFIDVTRKHKKDEQGNRYITEKERPISYATHKGSLIFSWYSYILSHLYENKLLKENLSDDVIAYRKIEGKNSYKFAMEVIDFCKSKDSCTTIAFDVRGFFDNLDHKRIKSVWKQLLEENGLLSESGGLPNDHYAVFKHITKYSYIDIETLLSALGVTRNEVKSLPRLCDEEEFRIKIVSAGVIKENPTHGRGIPQGASISSTLSNIYMLDFDKSVGKYVKSLDGLYRRYSDDIMVVVPSKKSDEIKSKIISEIKKLKLDIEDDKTDEVRVERRADSYICLDNSGKTTVFSYLGIDWDGKHVRLRDKTVARFYRKMSSVVYTAVKSAHDKGYKIIPKRMLYKKFTSFGNQNFLTYARNVDDALKDSKVGKQISGHKAMKKLHKQIQKSLSKINKTK